MSTGGHKNRSLFCCLAMLYCRLFVCFVFVMYSSRDKGKQGHVERFFAVKHEFKPEVLSIWRRCHWENCPGFVHNCQKTEHLGKGTIRAMNEGVVCKANFFALGIKIKESNLFPWYLLELIQTSQSKPDISSRIQLHIHSKNDTKY